MAYRDEVDGLTILDVHRQEHIASYEAEKALIRVFGGVYLGPESKIGEILGLDIFTRNLEFMDRFLYRNGRLYVLESTGKELVRLPDEQEYVFGAPRLAPDRESIFFIAHKGSTDYSGGTLYQLMLDDLSVRKILGRATDFAFYGERYVFAYQMASEYSRMRILFPGDFVVIDLDDISSPFSFDEFDYLNNREFVINGFDIRGDVLVASGGYFEFENWEFKAKHQNIIQCRIRSLR